jgi:hypothetical protein
LVLCRAAPVQARIGERDFIVAKDAISALKDIKGIRIGADLPDAAPVLFENPVVGHTLVNFVWRRLLKRRRLSRQGMNGRNPDIAIR